jgi:HD-like signal output (HDOD) protein
MIQGEIRTFPLTELIPWLALTRRTGMLVIAQGSDKGHGLAVGSTTATVSTRTGVRSSVELYFVAGELVGATSAGRAPICNAEQIFDLLVTALHWRTGRFAFSKGTLPAWALSSNLRLPVEALRLEQAAQREASPSIKPNIETELVASSDSFTWAERLRVHVVNQILQEDFKVPAFPALAARVLELTGDENFSLRALSDLVTKDQAIAAQVLRYANSALCGAGREVQSLEQAVQRLGVDEVVNIVLAASMQAHRRKYFRLDEELNRLWEQSAAAAFIARTVAQKTGLKGSVAFMCGLLMDFGATVLYSLMQDLLARRVIPPALQPQLVAEVIQDYHPRIGRAVGEQWQLPQAVIETMAHHHSLEECFFNQLYVGVAALADYLMNLTVNIPRAELQGVLECFPPGVLVGHPAGQLLQLNADTAVALLAALPRDLAQAHELKLA